MTALVADSAFLPTGWAREIRLEITPAGDLASCAPGTSEGAERLAGTVLPGMPNIHSHGFQRAMAGLTERAGGGEDSFWGWREIMYGFIGKIGPEDVQAIAAQLYVEMLKAGYTSVAEFHYLHHDSDGTPFGDRVTMSEAIVAAAAEAGIGLTLLPVLYQTGGFGGKPAGAGQRRFINSVDEILGMVEELRRRHRRAANIRVGLALHSLRAVPPDSLSAAVAGLRAVDADAPVHIHIAEQVREVEECMAWSGQRPVEWLADRVALDERWCLVHATHLIPPETARLIETGAVVGLCPTTEANLGDGFFPFADFVGRGSWGIGSDSHISVSPVEELRLLEYGQRLTLRERNIAGRPLQGSSGRALWDAATRHGAGATGRDVGMLAPGRRADLIVLDDDAPTLYGRRGDDLLDSLVFAGNVNPVRDVMVGGAWVLRDREHPREGQILARFKATIDRLTADAAGAAAAHLVMTKI
jgi:formimidoylglutamate deiminase